MAPSPPHRSPKRRRRSLVSSHEATTSCTPMPGEGGIAAPVTLANDLIFDVLSWLPLRSLCRFRCVSREWRALISDPVFLAAHKLHAEPVLVVSSGDPHTGRDLRMMDMDGNVVMVLKSMPGFGVLSSSQDSLICTTDYSYNSESACVIDPVARKVLVIARGLGQNNPILIGFGCAVPSSLHKVVLLSLTIDRTTSRCHVFTLGACGKWRRPELPAGAPVSLIRSSITVNGVVYFLAAQTQSENPTLLPFDLNTEKWKKPIEGPGKTVGRKLWRKTVMTRIAELNGALCMVQSKEYDHHIMNNIWLLTNQDIWVKAYTVPTDLSTNPCTPLRVTRVGGKLIFHCILMGEGLVVRVYDPHTKTCRTLWKLDADLDSITGLCSLSLEHFVPTKI